MIICQLRERNTKPLFKHINHMTSGAAEITIKPSTSGIYTRDYCMLLMIRNVSLLVILALLSCSQALAQIVSPQLQALNITSLDKDVKAMALDANNGVMVGLNAAGVAFRCDSGSSTASGALGGERLALRMTLTMLV